VTAIALTIDTRAVDQLLRRADAELRADILADALLAGGRIVAAEAAVKAPKRTGRLAAALDAEISVREDTVAEVDIGFVAGTNVAFIGRFQEFGVAPHELATGRRVARLAERGRSPGFHPGHPAQPFLTPALEERAEDVQRELREDIRRRVDALGHG